MSEQKLVHNAMYFINANSIYPLKSIDIQRFISMRIFPVPMFAPIVSVYLKEKNARVLQAISEYILYNYSAPPEHPISREELFNIIGEAISKTGINISDLQTYSKEEFQQWYEWYVVQLKEQSEATDDNSGYVRRK